MQNRTAYDLYAWQPRDPRRRVGTALATALCAACLSLAGLMLLPGLLGYQRYVITSGSMTGTYDRGSVVFDKVVPVADLQVGDAITYTPPPGIMSGTIRGHCRRTLRDGRSPVMV